MALSVVGLRFFFRDRIQWTAALLVASFFAVLLLSSQSRASYPTYVLTLLMLATFAQWRDVLRLSLLRWVLILLSWLSLSVFWSEIFVFREAVSIWSRSLFIIFFVVALAECLQRGQLQAWLGWGLTVVGALAVVAAIVNFYVTSPEDGRLNGLGQLDTHVVAALVYGVVLLFVVRTVQTTNRAVLRYPAIAIGIAVVLAVFLSDSRNAWVSVTAGVAIYLFALRCADPKQFIASVVSLVLIATLAFSVASTSDVFVDFLLPRGDSFRITIWSSTLERIGMDSFLFGRGILTNDDVTAGGIVFSHPHNMYLALLHQGGLVALILFGFVLAKAFSVLLQFYEEPDAKFALGLFAMSLSSYLLDGHELVDKVGDTWFLFWLPIGISLGISWKTALAAR